MKVKSTALTLFPTPGPIPLELSPTFICDPVGPAMLFLWRFLFSLLALAADTEKLPTGGNFPSPRAFCEVCGV